jgi:hypothetical protein
MLPPSLRRAFAALLPLGVALVLCPARAQVNVEVLRSDLKQRPYFVTLDGTLTGRLGNTQGIIAGASAFAGLMTENNLIFVKAQGDYTAFNGTPSVAKSFLHARYNYRFRPWLYGELFSQIQQDESQRLQFRNLEGIGPRFRVVQSQRLEIYCGTSYMFEYEALSLEPADPERQTTIAHRWNNYASLIENLDTRVRFTTVLYVQPRFDDFTDVRVLSESGITVQIKAPLSLKFGVVIRYDTQPPEGVLPFDLESKNSLSVSF